MSEDEKKASVDTGEPPPTKTVKKISRTDLEKVATRLKAELQERKRSEFRKSHEEIWSEVDRQVHMQPMGSANRDPSEPVEDWHNVIELGELSKASENISADVLRIVFPNARYWFDAHSAPPPQYQEVTDPAQLKKIAKFQERLDGRLRALMMAQHADFGLADRVELSIKEALHHGSFVAVVDWDEQQMVYGGTKVKTRGSPVWIPHSMWNCYPDPSPSVIGSNTFYEGSMYIESYLPRHLCEQLINSGKEGWWPAQWKKVRKDEHNRKMGDTEERTKDVEITTYWGDIVIPRTDGDLLYPNHKCILWNGTLVFLAPNPLPYVPVIFRGYERMDVRDPYYMSPIIKQSPMQKVASVLTNRALDGIHLKIEPPIVYDGNDPDFVLNGGPEVRPGAKVSSKSGHAFDQVEIGDPAVAIEGLKLCLAEMKEKLGRPGNSVGDRATKAEVVKAEADQEVGIVGFIGKIEKALRSYLYMQHAMNCEQLKEYDYYSPEMRDPDFLRAVGKDLPKEANFEVVGARGVLGEQERTQKMSMTTAFFAQSPIFAQRLVIDEIMLQMYQDAGVKNAEKFITQEGQIDPAQAKAQLMQMQQELQKVGGLLQQEKQKSAVKMAKIQSDEKTKGEKTHKDYEAKVAGIIATYDAKMKDLQVKVKSETQKMLEERLKANNMPFEKIFDHALEMDSKQQPETQNQAHAFALARVLDTITGALSRKKKPVRGKDGRIKDIEFEDAEPIQSKDLGDALNNLHKAATKKPKILRGKDGRVEAIH